MSFGRDDCEVPSILSAWLDKIMITFQIPGKGATQDWQQVETSTRKRVGVEAWTSMERFSRIYDGKFP